MMKASVLLFALLVALASASVAAAAFETDTFATSAGPLRITFVGHGTLTLEWDGKVIHVDPVGDYADYSQMPKADLVLITHEHRDHMDPKAVAAIRTDKTVVVLTQTCASEIAGGTVMANGDEKTILGIRLEAVPAYNLVHKRNDGSPYHPKGRGNGYILTLGGTRLYIAGDTENTPEMKALRDIDIAFLPMNLPFTMTPEMVADAAKAFRPEVLYPYHFGETDTSKIVELLKDTPGVDVRIRKMK
ncbi:MAG TPA: MBL fold metallo-hydrolase [Candidatus Sulfotelmatobacter sp.]|nr:MBL fold metallo-hydrolase [Candidatus Sulfotelmatobacter sp.]